MVWTTTPSGGHNRRQRAAFLLNPLSGLLTTWISPLRPDPIVDHHRGRRANMSPTEVAKPAREHVVYAVLPRRRAEHEPFICG